MSSKPAVTDTPVSIPLRQPDAASVKQHSSNLHEDSPERLATETHFSVAEVYSLQELYQTLSNTLHKDGLINKDEFMYALFKTHNDNLFADRVFEIFDIKQNHVIEFGEFVRSISVFHPSAPLKEKAQFAFRIYDLGHTGSIDRSEIKRFLVALMEDNPDLDLDEEGLEEIIDQTFEEAGVKNGKISPAEWQALVAQNPGMIGYMTLPVLRELTTKYPATPPGSSGGGAAVGAAAAVTAPPAAPVEAVR